MSHVTESGFEPCKGNPSLECDCSEDAPCQWTETKVADAPCGAQCSKQVTEAERNRIGNTLRQRADIASAEAAKYRRDADLLRELAIQAELGQLS